jgi:hypothetical protein
MEENSLMPLNSVKSKDSFLGFFQSYETRTIKIGPASEGKSEIKFTYTTTQP